MSLIKKRSCILTIKKKNTRPFSADNLSSISHSEILKKREENYNQEIEREKMEKEKHQRETVPSSTLQVNLIKTF